MKDYSFQTLRDGFKGLQTQIKNAQKATVAITVIVAASIVCSKEERESVGMKNTSPDMLRKFFRNHFGIQADTAEGKAVSRAVSSGIDLVEHIDRDALLGLNSFGAICNYIATVRDEVLNRLKEARKEAKAEKASATEATLASEKAAVTTAVSEPEHVPATLTDEGFYTEAFANELLMAIAGDIPRLSNEALSMLAAALNAEMMHRNNAATKIAV